MRRGTTPTITINSDLDLRDVAVLYLTFKQGTTTVLEKTLDDVTVTETTISFKMTQSEALSFNASRRSFQCQIRGRFPDGTTVASNIMSGSVSDLLKDGEI